MSRWSVVSYENIRDLAERLARFVGDIDPESPKGKKRRRILDAATELFIAHGYRKTNIDEIAKAAGIAKGTVYLYFATKTDVLLAAVAREKQQSLALLEEVFDADAPARERLRRWVRAALLMVANSPLIARVAGGDQEFKAALMDIEPELTATAVAENSEFLGRLLDEAVHPRRWKATDRQERIKALVALTFLAPMIPSEHIRQGMSIERFAEVMASVIVDGMNPPGKA